jgi:hypothetical protein
MTTTYDIDHEEETLAVIGKLAIDMYKVDPFYWERHYPVALVNVVQGFIEAEAKEPHVAVHTVMAGNDTFARFGWDDFVLYAVIDNDTGEVLGVSLSNEEARTMAEGMS